MAWESIGGIDLMIYLPSRTKRVEVDGTNCPSILPKDAETQTYSLPGAGEGGLGGKRESVAQPGGVAKWWQRREKWSFFF